MPPTTYHHVLQKTISLLQNHYENVDSPIDAPQKSSHGDIDILCCQPRSDTFDPAKISTREVTENIAKILGAKAWIVGGKDQSMNFAIPWPAEEELEHDGAQEKRFIQIDVHVFRDLEEYKWTLFHHAHSDLWNILGSTIRPYGLTANNIGLYLRIPSIELLDRKKSMVFLTSDPNEVLKFLGLDEEKWWTQFKDHGELMEYAAGNRCFHVRQLADDEIIGDVVGVVDVAGKGNGQEDGEEIKKKLKHNDRQRMGKRELFRRWIEEFIPKCRDEGRFLEERVTRKLITEEAKVRFGVGDEFDRREQEWGLKRHEEEVWKVVKGTVPEDVESQLRAAVVRELKRVVIEGEVWAAQKSEDGGDVPKELRKNADGYWEVEKVRSWVEKNWEQAGEIGWARQNKRALEGMKAKAEKKLKTEK
jgi:hypothetical protein